MIEVALRPLQIPCRLDYADDVVAAVSRNLTEAGIPEEDQPTHLQALIDEWIQSAEPPSGQLLELTKEGIRAGIPGERGVLLASNYKSLFERLAETISVTRVPGLISQAPFAGDLALVESMSATQVSLAISQRLGGVPVPWDAAQRLLSALDLKPELDIDAVRDVLESDAEMVNERFADSNAVEAAELVGVNAAELGYPGDCSASLLELFPAIQHFNSAVHVPYLQVLELQCLIVEFFDHPPQYLYEFAPRGLIATEVFSRYSIHTSNPMLNNFKAVEAADPAWARSRSRGQRNTQPAALSSILCSLGEMPYQARRTLAAWIRQWIRHLVGVAEDDPHTFPPGICTAAAVRQVFDFVAQANTETAGILEQRLIDSLASPLYEPGEGWRERGVGDSVNAANVPRRKLGDCDFQNTAQRTVVAFEPHGGRLSESYLEGHVKSLERVMKVRSDEWAGVADPAEWTAQIIFIAHGFDLSDTSPRELEILGVNVVIEFRTYKEFIGEVSDQLPQGALEASMDVHFFGALDRQQTPQAVRDKVANVLGISLQA